MAANSSSSPIAVLLLYTYLLHAATELPLAVSGASAVGFSAELIHRDSPESPFHDPSSTPLSRLHTAIHRSAARADQLREASSLMSSNSRFVPGAGINMSTLITHFHFNFILRFYLGTPPRLILAILDTASDLIWILCSVCKKCYYHKGRIFRPKGSSTNILIPCVSILCNLLPHRPCIGEHSLCEYLYPYGDGSHVEGLLTWETVSFDPLKGRKKVKLPRIVVGCTHHTKGKFSKASVGIVGLSGRNLSLISQVGPFIGYTMSYCLPSSEERIKSVRMYFGAAAVVAGPGAVSTPLYLSNPGSYYLLGHERITVVGPTGRTHTIMLEVQALQRRNFMIMDSGTYMTYTDNDTMFGQLEALKNEITNPIVDVPEALAHIIDFCVDWEYPTELPMIAFQFYGGAVVPMVDAFMLYNKTKCLIIASNKHHGGLSIYGSGAQLKYRIGIDLGEKRVTFRPENC